MILTLFKNTERRRQFFIKKKFQVKFILLYTLGISLLAGMTTYVLHESIMNALESHLYSSHLKIARSGDLLAGILLEVNTRAIFTIVLVVLVLSLIIFSRLNSHFRIIGEHIDATVGGVSEVSSLPKSRFWEVSRLITLVDETLKEFRQNREDIATLLAEIEKEMEKEARPETLQAYKAKLDHTLEWVRLP